MLNSIIAVTIGLTTGAVTSVAASCVWCALHLPARIQHMFHALTPRACAFAISTGLFASGVRMGLGLSLDLPPWCACLVFACGGMFVGMLAASLGEVTEVVPVLVHRMHIKSHSRAMRIVITLGKALGAFIACYAMTQAIAEVIL